ncbi:S8 family serine peptidase [Streptomyces sp. NPDC051976]|uniref:S8 family serine peptidase n=1 Tax=Streptomyces sp. NPDC051976 TaxID=3154947 RepID=UPI00343871DC
MRRTAIFAGLMLAAVTAMGSAGPANAHEPGSGYVVVLKDSASTDPTSVAHGVPGVDVGSVYRSALHGFSARLTPTAVQRLRANPAVAYVEADAVGHADGQVIPNGNNRIFTPANTALKVGDGLDQRVNADIAIIDTGIDHTHPDLNVVQRVNCLGSKGCVENSGTDDNGHGSNVAGIAAELDNGIGYTGVAPGARLWSIKVLDSDGSGSTEEIVAGIDYVTAHSDEIGVANLSLGFDGDVQAVKDAVNRAVAKGIVVVVSAGNDHRDVKNQTPANVPDVITVSSLSDGDGKPGGLGNFAWCNKNNKNTDDTLSDYSNFGTGVDIAAPGDCITSAYKNGGYSNYSGTSQAAPHVTGAAAWLVAGKNKPTDRAGVLAVRDKLVKAGNTNWTDTSHDGVKEPLLDLHDPAVFPAGGTNGPNATFVPNCSTGRSCTFDASLSTGSGLSYAWDFGDGSTGTGAQPSHTYAAYGQYHVKLTVTDSSGATSGNSTYVHLTDPSVNELPVASFTRFCTVSGYCGFDASASYDDDGTIASYAWNWGDGTAAGSGVKPGHTYPDRTGSYTATLTVTDDKGGKASATAAVTCTKLPYYTECSAS